MSDSILDEGFGTILKNMIIPPGSMDAITNANSPSATNPFATWTDGGLLLFYQRVFGLWDCTGDVDFPVELWYGSWASMICCGSGAGREAGYFYAYDPIHHDKARTILSVPFCNFLLLGITLTQRPNLGFDPAKPNFSSQ